MSFTFEGHELSWRRDITSLVSSERGYSLYIVRKPDADWPICVYRPNGRRDQKVMQFLDYNLRVR